MHFSLRYELHTCRSTQIYDPRRSRTLRRFGGWIWILQSAGSAILTDIDEFCACCSRIRSSRVFVLKSCVNVPGGGIGRTLQNFLYRSSGATDFPLLESVVQQRLNCVGNVVHASGVIGEVDNNACKVSSRSLCHILVPYLPLYCTFTSMPDYAL